MLISLLLPPVEMESEAPAALIGGQRMLAAHRQSVELSVDA